MPRHKTVVKTKHNRNSRSRKTGLITPGLVDIHFHGAFGIDLMTAQGAELDSLSQKLWENGVAAFCPTTLSVEKNALLQSVERLGGWIRTFPKNGVITGAVPLGIHLEGPFISPEARGAHPPDAVRALDFHELDLLWKTSQETLKILTVAPETLSAPTLSQLCAWAKKRKIILSAGHSQATQDQAQQAFNAGFSGVTHAWNALSFHHRAPGVLGAALGRKDVYVELIADQIHVDATLLRWTRQLHSKICLVSDCVPAAATRGKWQAFGPLQIRYEQGACRTASGELAGGGRLLPLSFSQWLEQEAQGSQTRYLKSLKEALPLITTIPLKALGQSLHLFKSRSVRWTQNEEGLYLPSPCVAPLPNNSR